MKNLLEETVQIKVRCPKEKVFAFHSDISNIAKVLPPFLNLQISHFTWPLEPGAKATLKFKLFNLIPILKWNIFFQEWKEPDYFIDETQGGIWKNFSHKHEFAAELNEPQITLVKDTVTFRSFNPFLDQVIRPFLKIFLISKLHSTKNYLERKYSPVFVF
ncbi:MAG: SRPBCC family protein [Candidatus Melainabacteria bacterium]|jgi:ligand-binding SRPBCC domain-containing protein